jgi:hypothetical protein
MRETLLPLASLFRLYLLGSGSKRNCSMEEEKRLFFPNWECAPRALRSATCAQAFGSKE